LRSLQWQSEISHISDEEMKKIMKASREQGLLSAMAERNDSEAYGKSLILGAHTPNAGTIQNNNHPIHNFILTGRYILFKELGPLLRQRTVVMILTRLEDDTIRVNVIPRKLKRKRNDALTTPLSVAARRKNWTPAAFRTGPVCRRSSRAEEHA